MLAVEQVVGGADARSVRVVGDRSLLGAELGGVVERLTLRRVAGRLAEPLRVRILRRQLGRDRSAVRREDVLLPVVEVELGGRSDLLLRASEVLHVGQPDGDLVSARALDLGLADAELIDAAADDVERAVERLGRHRRHLLGRLALVDELDAALEVEAEPRRLGRDREQRRGEQTRDEKQDEAVAAAVGHRLPILLGGSEHEQQTAVVVVGREEIGDRLGRQVALGVDRDRLVERADAPL